MKSHQNFANGSGMKFWILITITMLLNNCAGGCGKKGSKSKLPFGGGSDEPSGPAYPAFVTVESVNIGLGSFKEETIQPVNALKHHSLGQYVIADAASILDDRFLVVHKALLACVLSDPEEADTDVWTCSSAFEHESISYTVVTTASGDDGEDWSLVMSATPKDEFECCEDFEVVSGTRSDTETGEWTIYDRRVPAEPTALGVLSWVVDSEIDRTLKFTVSKEDAVHSEWKVGGVLTLKINEKDYTITAKKDPDADRETVVKWNRETNAGSIDEIDEDPKCWDGNLADVEC
jgi:hypothetical protein